MRVTLNGTLGSGKSTVGRELARRLGVRYISTGQIFREIGHISNLDALQTNLEAESNSALDEAVDNKVRDLNRTESDFVIDSRMAWHFVDHALHVFLSVSPEVAARRVIEDRTRLNEQYSSLASAMDALRARRNSELKRYQRLYSADIEDPAQYALWVITDDAQVDDVVEVILRRLENRSIDKMWIPKSRLVPMAAVGPELWPARVSSDLLLELCVAENFGFFFGQPAAMAAALSYELNLVSYEHHVPPMLVAHDVLAFARSVLKPECLREWEARAGVKLAFVDRLDQDAT